MRADHYIFSSSLHTAKLLVTRDWERNSIDFEGLWVQAAGINETFFLKSMPILGTNVNFKPVIKTVYRLTITYVRMNENCTSS